jgi:hypothetical protein
VQTVNKNHDLVLRRRSSSKIKKMKKTFLQLPKSRSLESIVISVKKSGGPEIGDQGLDAIRSTHGLEEIGRIYDLVSLLKILFYFSGKYFKKD